MTLSGQRKSIAVLIFVIAVATSVWLVVNVMQQDRLLEEANKAIWAIDFSPDSAQRDLRLLIALVISGVALWSRNGTRIAIWAGFVLFGAAELIAWVILPTNAFDRTDLEYHILAAVTLVLGVILWIRGFNDLMIALLAPAYVLMEFLLWYVSTVRLKALLSVDQGDPTSSINDFFYGAHWWHICVGLLSLLIIIFGITAVRKARGDGGGTIK